MPPRTLADADLEGILRSFDALSEAVDDLSEAVQNNAIDHATIKTKLEDVLSQIKRLSNTVSGDYGLVARVSVLESKIKSLEDMNGRLQSSHNDTTKTELEHARADAKDGRNRSISVWGAIISTLALLATIVFGTIGSDCASSRRFSAAQQTQE